MVVVHCRHKSPSLPSYLFPSALPEGFFILLIISYLLNINWLCIPLWLHFNTPPGHPAEPKQSPTVRNTKSCRCLSHLQSKVTVVHSHCNHLLLLETDHADTPIIKSFTYWELQQLVMIKTLHNQQAILICSAP